MKTKYRILRTIGYLFCIGFASSVIAQEWVQVGSDIDGEAAGDAAGDWKSVSISSDGSRVAIGAHRNSGNGAWAGHVRIYEYSGGGWIQLGADIDGEAAWDESGISVALSSDGSRVAIGAPNNYGTGLNSGHVRVYEYSGGSWIQLGADIDGEAVGDASGTSVALSSDGNRVAIGARNNDGNGEWSGQVRVYEYSVGNWILMGGADIDGEAAGDISGNAVALSSAGNRVAIGANANDGNGAYAGHVRVYEYSLGNWIQMGADIDGESAGDSSGISVSLSSDGNRVAIGAPYNAGDGSGSGHARVYEYSGGGWVQLGADIDGEAYADRSGYSVSLSSDGSWVAVGAPGNDGNGDGSGHIRIYAYAGGGWVQLGTDIDGEAAEDSSGYVSLSSDGSRVAIGAPGNDGNGVDSGHVRVYECTLSPLVLKGGNLEFLSTSNIQYTLLCAADLNTDFEVLTNCLGNGQTSSIPLDCSDQQRFYMYRIGGD